MHSDNLPCRNEYVSVNLTNVSPDKTDNFKRHNWTEFEYSEMAYDYRSIMHYPINAFARSTDRNTIESHFAVYQDFYGYSTNLSAIDAVEVAIGYNCSIPQKTLVKFVNENMWITSVLQHEMAEQLEKLTTNREAEMEMFKTEIQNDMETFKNSMRASLNSNINSQGTSSETTTTKLSTKSWPSKIQEAINGEDFKYMSKTELVMACSLAHAGVITQLNYFIPMGIPLSGVDPASLASLIAVAKRAQLRQVNFSTEQMAALAQRSAQDGWKVQHLSLWDVELDTNTARHWATAISNTPSSSNIRIRLSDMTQFYKDLKSSLVNSNSKARNIEFDLRFRNLPATATEEKEIRKLHDALDSWKTKPIRALINNTIFRMSQ